MPKPSPVVGAPPRRRRRRIAPGWRVVGGILAVVAVLAGVLSFTVLPNVLVNLDARAATVDTTVALTGGPGDASVVVPAGWSNRHPLIDDHTVIVRSPDGGLEVAFAALAASAGDAFQALAAGESGLPAPVAETLSSGLRAVHAATDDVVVAALAGASGSVTAVAHASGERPLADYLPTVAGLFAGVSAP